MTPRFIRIARYSPILMLVLAVIIGFAVSRDSVRSNPVMDQDGTQVFVLSTNVGLQAVPSGSLVGPVEPAFSGAVAADIAAPISYLFTGKSIFPSFYDTPASAVLKVPSVSGSQNGRSVFQPSAPVLDAFVRYLSTNTVEQRSWVNVLRTSTSLSTSAGTKDLSFIPAVSAGGEKNVDNYVVRLASSSGPQVVDLYIQAVEWNDGQTLEIASDATISARALTDRSLAEGHGSSRLGNLGNTIGDSVGAGTITGIVDYPVSAAISTLYETGSWQNFQLITVNLRSMQSIVIVGPGLLVLVVANSILVLGIVVICTRTRGVDPSPSDKNRRISKGFGAPNFAGGFTAG